jgi:exonuclease-1
MSDEIEVQKWRAQQRARRSKKFQLTFREQKREDDGGSLQQPHRSIYLVINPTMGVKGLLPCLQSITRSVSLERYRGLTVAVDAMSWLHKGVFACDVKALAKSQRGRSELSSSSSPSADIKCINFTMKKADHLRANFGMEVILVIDGDSLPCKKEENERRRVERDVAFQKAVAAEEAGDSRAARRFYAQSCSVTHKIRYELIKTCKQAGIAFLVAPYEADAQMARMAHTGSVDLVITEDSDTLAYGCPRVLFKIDFDTNRGQEIQLMRDLGKNTSPSFRNWTHDMFVFMCILSGCDYCDGIPGIGIKLAHKVVRVHRTPSKIFTALRVAGRMTREFEDKFWIAFRTFRHQRVYCPSKQQIETLWPIVGSNHNANPNDVWPFLGEHIDPRIASRIADGTLHPATKTDWRSALRQELNVRGRHSNEYSVGDIHHRKSSHNAARRDRCRSTSDGKENIWHALVYGTKECHDRDDAPVGKDRNKQSKAIEPTKDGMFNFFPTKNTKGDREDRRKRGRDDGTADDVRPPLTEIYLGGLDSGNNSSSKSKSKYVPPSSHKDVPIHFHEYSSRLVGKSFKPMSRKRRKEANCGSKSSRCVQKIWEKSKAQTHHAETYQAVEAAASDGKSDEANVDHGVSLFQKNTTETNQEHSDHLESGDDYESGHGWDRLYTESYTADHSSHRYHHQPSSSSIVDDGGGQQMVESQYSDYLGQASSTHHHQSSVFDFDNQTQPFQSDSSLTGAYTTVTAEPHDLFPSLPKDVQENLFTEEFSTALERDCGEEQYPIEPTIFQPTHHHAMPPFDPQMLHDSKQLGDFGSANPGNEEDLFCNFHVPEDSHARREEEFYAQIDDCLLSDLAIMQQM